MIEIVKTIDPQKLLSWCESELQPHLKPDVSSYAPGRLRLWLGQEPMLFSPWKLVPAHPIPDWCFPRLRELLGWNFDFCLVTFAGKPPIGITPHRDAGYADYESYGLNLSGWCEFNYWNSRNSFNSFGPVISCPPDGPPSHSLTLLPGDIVRFNCKNLHSASPSENRWNLNFWKAKRK